MTTPPSDNPIESATEDVLGRATMAKAFAEQVVSLDVSKGIVVGVLGPWGSGKTSFVNMALEQLGDRTTIIHFNPWMFSGAEQLVQAFFTEVAAQLKLKGYSAIGDELADYGEAFAGLGWLPFLGPWIERGRGAAKVIGKLVERRRQGIEGRRAKLEQDLSRLDKPVVVVVDDIDRLSKDEVRDVFKLVRLTASFPNVLYLVSFDRKRVEQALSEEGIPGRDYLEKILQVAVDLPAIPGEVLVRVTLNALDDALKGVEARELDSEAWPDVFMEIIRPLIGNVRDVRRYAAAVRGTVADLGDQIALADLLAMEAIRVFLPDTFSSLQEAAEALTTPSQALGGGDGEPEGHKALVEALQKSAGERAGVARATILRLFPFARRYVDRMNFGPDFERSYLRDRRIGHEAILGLYLERVAGESLQSFLEAEKAWAILDDKQRLGEFLRSLDRKKLEDVIAALETYEDEYRPEHVVPATVVLMNLLPELPDRERGMFDLEARFTVGRVTYRLLRSLEGPDEVEEAVREILPELTTFSSKWEVITDIGYREGAGHKLVSEDAASELERKWARALQEAPAEDLARSQDLVRMIYFANEKLEKPIEIPDDPAVTLAALESVKSDARSQSVGSRSVRREPRLAWEPLVEVFGGEEVLQDRLESIKESGIPADPDLLALADRYAGGWRPPDFMRAGEVDKSAEDSPGNE